MQFYWKCEECDETNPYPNVKVCETCGSPMTPVAEQRVLREQKEEERRQAKIRKEQERKRREEQRARQEAERKRQEALRAAQQAEQERKRREQLEQTLKRREAKEARFASILRKCTRLSSGFMKTFAVLAVVVTVVLFIQNDDSVKLDNSLQGISDNIHSEYLAHTVVKTDNLFQENADETGDSDQVVKLDESEEKVPHVLSKVAAQVSSTFSSVSSNIEEQLDYLKNTYKPAENISVLVADIVEFLSGGVKE